MEYGVAIMVDFDAKRCNAFVGGHPCGNRAIPESEYSHLCDECWEHLRSKCRALRTWYDFAKRGKIKAK